MFINIVMFILLFVLLIGVFVMIGVVIAALINKQKELRFCFVCDTDCESADTWTVKTVPYSRIGFD